MSDIRKRNIVLCVAFIIILAAIRPELSLEGSRDGSYSASDQSNPVVADKKTSIQNEAEYLRGIDVSHYDGKVDWERVSNDDIHFVFIKSTEGTTYIDPRFRANDSALSKTDMPFGVYHFFHPDQSALAQAKHYLKVSGRSPRLPPVIDVEITSGVDQVKLVSGVKEWLDHVKSASGCQPIIYTGLSFWNTHLADHFDNVPLWIAEYRNTFSPPLDNQNWIFWQSSDKGKISGIKGNVDISRFNGTLKDINSIICGRN